MLIFECSIAFSEKLKKARGVYTDEQVARCSELGGQFGRHLEELFHSSVGSEHLAFQGDATHVDDNDVQSFLSEFVEDKLWDNVPGRAHPGFETMRHGWKVKNCADFAKKMAALSQKLDLWRNFVGYK